MAKNSGPAGQPSQRRRTAHGLSGEVPARLPGGLSGKAGFQFEAFRPQSMNVDQPLPHIRLDAALEF